MSLTISSTPSRIDNSGAWTVATSLTEDASHVNLRVRAEIYHEGIIKGTVERPAGILSFDFSDLLKSLVPGISFARDSGAYSKTEGIGADLITSWASYSGTWDTFVAGGNNITLATKAAAASVMAGTNDITMTVGKIYVVITDFVNGFVNTGVNLPGIYLSTSDHAGEILETDLGGAGTTKSVILIPTTTAARKILIGNANGQLDFIGQFHCYELDASAGSPLAPYFVKFTEVYEDSSGVTHTGTPITSGVFRFVPAPGDSIAFSNYVMLEGGFGSSTYRFASKTLRNNIAKVWTATPYEYWLVFFTPWSYVELVYSKNGGAINHATHFNVYNGWGAILLNDGELLNGVTSSLAVYLTVSYAGVSTRPISETITIYPDSSQVSERVVLEFDGLAGGKEYLAFDGITEIGYTTERTYYKDSSKVRRPISLTGVNRQRLETLFKDMANADYLKSLLTSQTVKKLEASYATPTNVTVISESVKTNEGRDMFTNTIDIEY